MLSYQFELHPDLRVLPFHRVSVQIGRPYSKKGGQMQEAILATHFKLAKQRASRLRVSDPA
jgi:hypothetical protein